MPNKTIDDFNKILPINELYTAVQAEGSRTGMPTVVVRTTGCTHRCWFGESGGWCDAWYSSIHPEKGKYTINDIIKMYDDNPHISEMMLTGGSPTMHPAIVNTLNNFCHERGIVMTIETEGSHKIDFTDKPIGLVSISPKFSNTIPKLGIKTPQGAIVDQKMIDQHNKHRLDSEAIYYNMNYHMDYHMKPVVNPIQDPEIWQEVKEFLDSLGVPKSKTYIMPPGDNRAALFLSYGDVMNFCRDNGYNFTGRPHIIAFDTERCV